MKKCTIVLRENEIRYKISKIIFYGNNAGFGVLCPYHNAKSGFLMKVTNGRDIYSKYSEPTSFIINEQQQFLASDRVKLSIHADGFTQFSGENPNKILSGRDFNTGQAKGLGIFSNPLNMPIMSGPTFAIQLWGLKDFTVLQEGKKDEMNIEFFEEDYEYRETNKEEYNAYIIEGFVFPPLFWSFSFYDDLKRAIVKFRHPGFQHENLKPLTFRVLPFIDDELSYMVALLVSRANHQITELNPSGFIFNSPSEFHENKVISIHAFYPAPEFNEAKASSLDYLKE